MNKNIMLHNIIFIYYFIRVIHTLILCYIIFMQIKNFIFFVTPVFFVS